MTIHIGAEPGQIAETVLMPGDPLRAKWAAETFLEAPECVNKVRGMLGYTGTWRGHRVTIRQRAPKDSRRAEGRISPSSRSGSGAAGKVRPSPP